MIVSRPKMVKSFFLISSTLAPSSKTQNLLVTWPHWHIIVTRHCHCGCLDTKWLSRDKQFKCTLKQSKLLVKTLGRWQYENRNCSPWRYKFKKSRDNNKKHTRSVFCPTRTPSEITKAETLRPSDSGFLLDDFFGGAGGTEYLTQCFIIIIFSIVSEVIMKVMDKLVDK